MYPGVGIHANIIENIVERKFLRRGGIYTHAVVYLILGLVIGVIAATSWGWKLFSIGQGYRRGLKDNQPITGGLRTAFKDNYEIDLSKDATVRIEKLDSQWLITDGRQQFTIREAGDQLNVCTGPGPKALSERGYFSTLGLLNVYLLTAFFFFATVGLWINVAVPTIFLLGLAGTYGVYNLNQEASWRRALKPSKLHRMPTPLNL